MSTNRSRWATSVALAATLMAATLGLAGPAAAATSQVQITLHLNVSGTFAIPDADDRLITYPVDSVWVVVYDRNGRRIDSKCVTEPDWSNRTAEQHVLTPPEGVTVTAPKGGAVHAMPAMGFCYFLALIEGTVVQKLNPANQNATVNWHLHP